MTIGGDYDVKDLGLAERGPERIAGPAREMPVLRLIRERFAREQPLAGPAHRGLPARHHRDRQPGARAQGRRRRVTLCACNPLSTQDDVAAALVASTASPPTPSRARTRRPTTSHIDAALDHGRRSRWTTAPTWSTCCTHRSARPAGRRRRRHRGDDHRRHPPAQPWRPTGALKFPIIAVNEAHTKHFFDNRYGTGQSTLDGIIRATNILLAGKNFVVGGYGWCGRGLAMRARGMGAHVIVTEIDPTRALEAVMDGYRVMPMDEAAQIGDIFVTVTGDINVIDARHFEAMKDGAIVANSGHFNDEINIPALADAWRGRGTVRDVRRGVRAPATAGASTCSARAA